MKKLDKLDVNQLSEEDRVHPFRQSFSNTNVPANYYAIVIKNIFMLCMIILVARTELAQSVTNELGTYVFGQDLVNDVAFIAFFSYFFLILIGLSLRAQNEFENPVLRFLGVLLFSFVIGCTIPIIISFGEYHQLFGFNMLVLIIVGTLSTIFISMIVSLFILYNPKKFMKMLLTFLSITAIVSVFVREISFYIPVLNESLSYLTLHHPLVLIVSLNIIMLVSYMTMYMFGALKDKLNIIDKRREWYCSSSIIFAVLHIHKALLIAVAGAVGYFRRKSSKS